MNLTQTIGALVSSRICSLHELQTVYGLEDAFNLLEIVNTDAFNKAQQATCFQVAFFRNRYGNSN